MEEGVPCPAPAPKLAPPIKKSQDIQDERSKLVNEYACRVLELLGMGHRLFVPRLLAVRSLFFWNGCIANLSPFSLHLSLRVHCMIVWGFPYFMQYIEEVVIPDCYSSGHWASGLGWIWFPSVSSTATPLLASGVTSGSGFKRVSLAFWLFLSEGQDCYKYNSWNKNEC